MSKKTNKRDSVEGIVLSDSVQLFNDIFSEEATDDPSEILEEQPDVENEAPKRKGKPALRQPGSAHKASKDRATPSAGHAKKARTVKSPSTEKRRPDTGKKPKQKKGKQPVSSVDSQSVASQDKRIKKRSDKTWKTVRLQEGEMPLQSKPKKRLNPIVLILLIVVLAALSGFFLNKYGIVDLNKHIDSVIGSVKPAKEDKIRQRIAQKAPDKRAAKKVSKPAIAKEPGKGKPETNDSSKTPQAQKGPDNRVAKAANAPSVVKEPGKGKPETNDSPKTPQAQKEPDDRVAKAANAPSVVKEPGKGKPETNDSPKTPQAQKEPDNRVAKAVSAPPMEKETGKGKPETDDSLKTPPLPKTSSGGKQNPSVSLHAGKSHDEKIPDLMERTVLYPYSMYLGSFQTLEGVHTTVAKYRKMGLSPYWIKLDLGEKGTWFRVFAGYFQTRKGADTFIKVNQLREAESRHTMYANLIGTYTSVEALDMKKTALLKLGYSPYLISDKKGVYRLFVGAFYQKVRAEKQNADLASKGIQSKLVNR